MTKKLCIIGGGASATFIVRGKLQHRILRGGADEPVEIIIVEPRDVLGLGPAWQEPDPRMSANMTTSSLLIYGGYLPDTGDFDIYKRAELFAGSSADAANSKTYVKRATVGEALRQEWQLTEAVAEIQGVKIQHKRAKATGVKRHGQDFIVSLSDGSELSANCIALALGLLARDRYPDLTDVPGYFAESWNWDAVRENVDGGDRVAILGLGPTAIDWMLRLSGLNLRHPIVASSPSGELPGVRPRVEPNSDYHAINPDWIRRLGKCQKFTPREIHVLIWGVLGQAGVTGDELDALGQTTTSYKWERFQRSLRKSGDEQPLFNALKMLDELMPIIWQYADYEGRIAIRDSFAPRHRRLSFAIPPATALALTDLVRLGRVHLYGGLSEPITHDGKRFCVPIDNAEPVYADILINATGSEGPISQIKNDLVHDLLKSDLIVADAEFGGVLMNPHTGHALTRTGQEIPGIFIAGGSLSRGARFMTNTLIGTSELGLAVGRNMARYVLNLEANSSDREPVLRLPAKSILPLRK
jgi:uncharacterized NAD(P)/FAD-binding protein YdhS